MPVSRFSTGLYSIPIMLLLLGGCSLIQTKSNDGFLITRSLKMPFLPLSGVDAGVDLTQQVTLSTTKGSERFLLRLQIEPEKLTMVGLTPLGQKLFQIQYSDSRAELQKTPFAPSWLDPGQLLGDYQIIYWLPDSINRPLRGSPLRLERSQQPPLTRTLYRGDAPVLKIVYHDGMNFQSAVEFHHSMENRRMKIIPLKTP